MKILVTGGSGYVGSRLVDSLVGKGHEVRVLARRPEFLVERFPSSVEVVGGDLQDCNSLSEAFSGIEVAFYLVHSLAEEKNFEDLETRSARNFIHWSNKEGIKRVIYLGALTADSKELSAHMKSRQDVGHMLRRESHCPVIELRASIVIGAGSLSFEMIRALVERLPIMTTPRWVSMKSQPIFIDDLLSYLEESIAVEIFGSQIFEIGGREVVSYKDLMLIYAKQRGLRRLMISLPVLSPRLSSYWLGLVTPLFARVGRRLIESIVHSSIVHDDSARKYFGVNPIGASKAIELTMQREDKNIIESTWHDSVSSSLKKNEEYVHRRGNSLFQVNQLTVSAKPKVIFDILDRIGGKNGWYYANFLWKFRAILDLLVGGVGFKRGRPKGRKLRVGDVLDWWRVVSVKPNRELAFEAEMKLPGKAWLKFELEELGEEKTRLKQTAIYDPRGLLGLLYWYLLYPIHIVIFRGLLKSISKKAEGKES